MTNREFSDSFDTLLNSYASQATFGDQAAASEIVLDEYEKSVLLTQAQDKVIKSYFESHTNELGQGFDDSSRRQVDFSSLIKVATLSPSDSANKFDSRGIIYKLPTSAAEDGSEYSRVLYILNEALIGYTGSNKGNFVIGEGSTALTRMTLSFTNTTSDIFQIKVISDPSEGMSTKCIATFTAASSNSYALLSIVVGNGATSSTVTNSINSALASTALADITISISGQPAISSLRQSALTLMPVGFVTNVNNETRYVIIPINYKEYDREMSKAYAQPLKKQAWRLFQNISTGYDIYSELIPIWNVDTENLTYKVRYVERPTPIVLTDLPNNLSVDGYSHEQSCALNPIIHSEILEEAVRMAITSRASAVARAEAYRDAAQRNNRNS